jgi:4-diphosphocytidyl-2-C-methyl-D-erythritol kinase
MKKIDLKAYAKINLSIDVLGVLPDGYHEVAMVMQQIDLCDEICVKWIPEKREGIEIEIGSNKRYLPVDGRNLAHKAAKLMIERFDVPGKFGPGKVRIDIKKQIPVGAGLGGGSADCAGVLRGLSEIWGLDMSLPEMMSLGGELGADVPFCILGQAGNSTALAEGTGTKLTTVSGMEHWLVLSKPPISISTAEVYKGFDLLEDRNFQRPNTEKLISAMKGKDLVSFQENIVNVLENYVLMKYPVVAKTKEKMIEETAPMKAVMSGSGPTVIGFYATKEKAETAYEKMKGFNKETFLTKTMM